MVRFIALSALLISLTAFGTEYITLVDYFGNSQKKKKCDSLVTELFSDWVDGDFKSFSLGGEVMLEQMMIDAKVDPSLRTGFKEKVLPIRKMTNTGSPELNELNRFLDLNYHKIFACVLPQGCTIRPRSGESQATKSESVGPYNGSTSITMGAFIDLGSTNLQLSESVRGTHKRVKTRASGLPRVMDFIFLNHPRPESSNVATLSETYFHEMGHFMDYNFLSSWIKANQIRMNIGKKPDGLFEKYVEIYKVGTLNGAIEDIVIDNGFFLTFFETNAYVVGYAAYRLAASANDLKPIKTFESRLYSQIADSPSGIEFLKTFGVNEGKLDGIFDIGRTLKQLMQPTIDSVEDQL